MRVQVSGNGSIAQLAAVARDFHERQNLRSPRKLADLIHEDAEVSDIGRRLHGRDEIVEVLEEERQAFVYMGNVDRYELLDESTLLVSGRARVAVAGGYLDWRVFWLDVFRDGLLWRVSAFPSPEEAGAADDVGQTAASSRDGGRGPDSA